jgi:hypothetical protein
MIDEKNEKSGEVTKTEEKKQGEISTASTEKKMATGEGSINVDDQPSGVRVELGELMFPEKSGWVVVRDYKDGTFGNALGASFYNVDMGIKPTSIELVRATAKNTEYHVSFFTNSGAMDFKNGEDTMVEGISDTFKTTE